MQTLGDWLGQGPYTLGLSSGFFGFFAHAGLLSALEEADLLPAAVVGSSAGALCGGLWAAGISLETIREELAALRRADFWDPSPGFGLLRGRLFRHKLEAMLPVHSFAGCRVPLAVSVFDLWGWRTAVLDRGELASALQASCAVPAMFQPCWREGRPLLDGGILDRPGLAGAGSDTRIFYHHLAARSPWRRPNSSGLVIPKRPKLTALVIADLPRLGPFRLADGPKVICLAKERALRGLESPLRDSMVHV